MSAAEEVNRRILVLAPLGRDAVLAEQVLGRAGMPAQACADANALCAEIRRGAGALLLAEEALTPHAIKALEAVLAKQEAWSDLPIVVLSSAARTEAWAAQLQQVLAVLGNITFLERPVRMATIITAMKAALRARDRQYLAREYLSQVAREEEATRIRADFEQHLIGIVSHDLRNPISAILLAVEALMRREDLDAHVTKGLVRIANSGQRAVRMIRDLLDFTQARLGGGIRIERRESNLVDIARQAADEIQAAHPTREIDFRAEGDGAGWWDADRLAQVVGNLASNAVTYSPPDSRITITVRSEPQVVSICVHNRGEPIPPDQIGSLFEPYRRGANEGRRNSNIGLGLFIVAQLARAHAGSVDVTSTGEEGTTFTVRLPRIRAEGDSG